MEKVNTMADQSAWFRQYDAEVNATKKASNSKKYILIIIPLLLIGGAIAAMINNGALKNEQTKGGVYLLAGIGAFLILMVLILTAKTKKGDAADITRKDLDELFKTPQDAADFDVQMSETPKFTVSNRADEFIFATRDYIGTKFKFLGDVKYRFIRISDVAILHTLRNSSGSCDIEFRDSGNNVLLIWVAANEKKLAEVKAALATINLNLSAM